MRESHPKSGSRRHDEPRAISSEQLTSCAALGLRGADDSADKSNERRHSRDEPGEHEVRRSVFGVEPIIELMGANIFIAFLREPRELLLIRFG
jgi:hypothetical protein